MFNRKKKFTVGPVITLTVIMLVVMVISSILSALQIEGKLTLITNGALETTLITVKNIFSVDGIKFIFGSAFTNFAMFKPMTLVLMSLITVSIMEASGLIFAVGNKYKKFKIEIILFLTLLVGVLFNFVGDFSYAFLIPLAGVFYKSIGRNPIIGVITMFLGISLGYSASIFMNFDMYSIGQFSEVAATIDLDNDYQFLFGSNIYISILSLISFLFMGTYVIKTFILMKVPEFKYDDEEQKYSRKGLNVSYLSTMLLSLLAIYMVVPGLYGSGALLDMTKETYIEQLFSNTAPFRDAIAYIILLIAAVSSYIYGNISKNITDSKIYSQGFAKSFEKTGYIFILFFLIAQIGAIIDWTNLGNVLTVLFVDLISSLGFTGIPLIITLFVMVILIGILMPGATAKWNLIAPLMIPLFMRANMTPDFTRYIYMMADGVSKTVSPLFPYFLLVLVLIDKYNKDKKYKVTIFSTMKFLRPAILMILGLWLLIAICFYIIGLPLGPNTLPTL